MGTSTEISTRTKIKIAFNDLDPMNIVWHGNYVKYLEAARCDFFEQLKYTYMDMYRDGSMYPIAKMDFKFMKSAKLGDEIEVECILRELEPAIVFKYNIYLDGKRILTASTMQMRVDVKTGETLYQAPEKLKKAIEDFNA